MTDPGLVRSSVARDDVWATAKLAWRELHRRPPLAWLSPRQEVALFHADGRQSLWRADENREIAEGNPDDAAFIAVEVPAADALERRLELPLLPERDRESALALELGTHSPFPPDQLVWGNRTAGGAMVAMLTTRQAVSRAVDAAEARSTRVRDAVRRGRLEAWAIDADGCPVVLRGFGERARLAGAGRGLGLAWAMIATALLLATLGLLTPTIQLKVKARQAVAALAATEHDFGPIAADRDKLAQVLALQVALAEQMEARIEPLAILDLVTDVVPDDAWLQRMELRGARLTISGQTTNATALMRRLSDHPFVRDVRSPGAATRVSGGRENFVIELTLLPQALRPAANLPEAAASVRSASSPQTGQPTPAAASQPATTASGGVR